MFQLRYQVWILILGLLLALVLAVSSVKAGEGPVSWSENQTAEGPVLVNPGFECSQGFGSQLGIDGSVPLGWTGLLLDGRPELDSSRVRYTGQCGDGGFVERIEGLDSLVMVSEDIETPPHPGKPFDALVYQRTSVLAGTAYSLSSWMVSLCGGSAIPNDCPDGYYMSKMLGIDPTGGVDPEASSVVWIEDLRNFTESGWANLRLGTTAQEDHLTIFARIRSPFRWHGAHAFLDAISLVRSPTAHFVGLPALVDGNQVTVGWNGSQSPDIAAIPGGTYELLYDIQVREDGADSWTDWLVSRPAGEALFTAAGSCGFHRYQFRLRARSEQPPGSNGAWPNHRYPGDWSQPATVIFLNDMPPVPRVFLPLIN
ncbi:MAG: hypothetical protein U9R25_14260 [Chloroflexota bacterium]|nr:hypothetical protein [Chloroflexota bacterium]